MMMALFAGIFIVLFLIGTPIAVALGATSLFNMEVFDTIAVSSFTKLRLTGSTPTCWWLSSVYLCW